MRLGLSREKKKGQALPYLLVCILFLSRHTADLENWQCSPSLKGKLSLPPLQRCLGSLSPQSPHGLIFPMEQTLQHALSLKMKTKQLVLLPC